jgi:hypothetical protein
MYYVAKWVLYYLNCSALPFFRIDLHIDSYKYAYKFTLIATGSYPFNLHIYKQSWLLALVSMAFIGYKAVADICITVY